MDSAATTAGEEAADREKRLEAEQERLKKRQTVLKQLSREPAWVNYASAFTASCVSTLIMHPIDTIKTRVMATRKNPGGEVDEAGAGGDGDGDGDSLQKDDNVPYGVAGSATATAAPPAPPPVAATSDTEPEGFNILELYDGVIANIVKEAPASALYLGLYEVGSRSSPVATC